MQSHDVVSLAKPRPGVPRRAAYNEIGLTRNDSGDIIVIDDKGDLVENLSDLDRSFTITAPAGSGGATTSACTITLVDANGVAAPTTGALLRCRICDDGLYEEATNATIAVGDGCTLVDTVASDKDIVVTNATATASTGTLTIAGSVADGETVTIGSRVYQFWTGLTALSGSNVKADISAGGTKSTNTLTLYQPIAGDSITVGGRTYVFVANGTANFDGEIGLGASIATTQTAFIAAINGTDSVNTANTQATCGAFTNNVATITARYTGVQGDSVVTTDAVTSTAQAETFTAVADVSDSLDGTYFILSDTDGTVAFWIDTDNSGTAEPSHGADRAVEITTIATDDSAGTVATKVAAAVNGDSKFTSSADSTTVTVTHVDIEPLDVGTAGDSGFTSFAITVLAGNAAFSAATLGSGADVSAANAVTALVAAIEGDASAIVGAADGAGDTVDITADTAGEAGDAIATTETFVNGSSVFGAATLTGGADGSLAVFNVVVTNASDETVTLRLGPPPLGLNYRANFAAEADITFSA